MRIGLSGGQLAPDCGRVEQHPDVPRSAARAPQSVFQQGQREIPPSIGMRTNVEHHSGRSRVHRDCIPRSRTAFGMRACRGSRRNLRAIHQTNFGTMWLPSSKITFLVFGHSVSLGCILPQMGSKPSISVPSSLRCAISRSLRAVAGLIVAMGLRFGSVTIFSPVQASFYISSSTLHRKKVFGGEYLTKPGGTAGAPSAQGTRQKQAPLVICLSVC